MNRYDFWTSSFNDESTKIGTLYPGEIKYRKRICKESLLRHHYYCKDKINVINDKLKRKRKTVILLNGEIRFLEQFLPWAEKISRVADIYIYTDRSSYFKFEMELRNRLERVVKDLKFSEDDELYKSEKLKIMPQGSHQWLKLKVALILWEKEWRGNEIEYVFRVRSDIAFYNPYLIEYNIYKGFENLKKDSMIARSDILFAFHIDTIKDLSKFYDEIQNFYLKKTWYEYPFIPINPNVIINSIGATRIEWCSFPTSYIGTTPTRNNFFENFIRNYELIESHYEDFKKSKKFDINEKKQFYGKLATVRYQPNNIFESERTFAHYLARKSIKALNHKNLFSGKIMRKYSLFSKIKQLAKNIYFD